MPFGNQTKKYWIIPQAALAPADLLLGSILKRPNDPIDILNRRAIVPIDPLDVIREREQVTKSLSNALNTSFGSKLGASSVLAAVLGAAPSLEGNWGNGVSDTIEAQHVRAQHFLPAATYVDKALHTSVIDDFVRQSFFTAPIYMVVGIAVASALSRTASASKSRGGGAGIGIGPPGTGVEVSGELSAHRDSESSYQDSVEEEVVLAYRIRRFRYSRRRKVFVKNDEDETKHAFYSSYEGRPDDDEEVEEDADGDDIAAFTFWEDDDVTASGIGMQGFAEDGDEDESSDSS